MHASSDTHLPSITSVLGHHLIPPAAAAAKQQQPATTMANNSTQASSPSMPGISMARDVNMLPPQGRAAIESQFKLPGITISRQPAPSPQRIRKANAKSQDTIQRSSKHLRASRYSGGERKQLRNGLEHIITLHSEKLSEAETLLQNALMANESQTKTLKRLQMEKLAVLVRQKKDRIARREARNSAEWRTQELELEKKAMLRARQDELEALRHDVMRELELRQQELVQRNQDHERELAEQRRKCQAVVQRNSSESRRVNQVVFAQADRNWKLERELGNQEQHNQKLKRALGEANRAALIARQQKSSDSRRAKHLADIHNDQIRRLECKLADEANAKQNIAQKLSAVQQSHMDTGFDTMVEQLNTSSQKLVEQSGHANLLAEQQSQRITELLSEVDRLNQVIGRVPEHSQHSHDGDDEVRELPPDWEAMDHPMVEADGHNPDLLAAQQSQTSAGFALNSQTGHKGDGNKHVVIQAAIVNGMGSVAVGTSDCADEDMRDAPIGTQQASSSVKDYNQTSSAAKMYSTPPATPSVFRTISVNSFSWIPPAAPSFLKTISLNDSSTVPPVSCQGPTTVAPPAMGTPAVSEPECNLEMADATDARPATKDADTPKSGLPGQKEPTKIQPFAESNRTTPLPTLSVSSSSLLFGTSMLPSSSQEPMSMATTSTGKPIGCIQGSNVEMADATDPHPEPFQDASRPESMSHSEKKSNQAPPSAGRKHTTPPARPSIVSDVQLVAQLGLPGLRMGLKYAPTPAMSTPVSVQQVSTVTTTATPQRVIDKGPQPPTRVNTTPSIALELTPAEYKEVDKLAGRQTDHHRLQTADYVIRKCKLHIKPAEYVLEAEKLPNEVQQDVLFGLRGVVAPSDQEQQELRNATQNMTADETKHVAETIKKHDPEYHNDQSHSLLKLHLLSNRAQHVLLAWTRREGDAARAESEATQAHKALDRHPISLAEAKEITDAHTKMTDSQKVEIRGMTTRGFYMGMSIEQMYQMAAYVSTEPLKMPNYMQKKILACIRGMDIVEPRKKIAIPRTKRNQQLMGLKDVLDAIPKKA